MKNLAILSILLVLVSCGGGKSELDKKKEELSEIRNQFDELKTKIMTLEKEIAILDTVKSVQKPKLVTLQPVENIEFKHYIDIQGTVDSDENINVQPGMPGIVTRVLVKEGDPVTAGQLLAETDSRTIRESIAQLQTNIDLAKTTFEKQDRLWKQKIGSEIQYLQAKTQYESLQKSLATLQVQLDMSKIKSPINGIVDEVNVKLGEFATPGPGLFRVVNANKLKVVAKVADSYLTKIKVGAPVMIYLKDINDTIQGKVSFISRVVNPLSRTFVVEISLPNTNNNLRANMLASVSINDENIPNARCIPANYIQRDPAGNTYVIIAEEQKDKLIARKKFVTTGLSYGNNIVIESGLNEDDRFIASGYQEVVDGQSVILK
jgi:membrane fusion protein (multidrug efflux system)